jgi:hypothetical protein
VRRSVGGVKTRRGKETRVVDDLYLGKVLFLVVVRGGPVDGWGRGAGNSGRVRKQLAGVPNGTWGGETSSNSPALGQA